MMAYVEKLTCKKVQVDIEEGEGDTKTVWVIASLTSYNFTRKWTKNYNNCGKDKMDWVR